MNGGLSARVLAMRREFDEAFARAPAGAAVETEALLRISAAGGRYFVRLRDVAAVHPRGAILPVPSARPGLIGLASPRGRLLPVYALGALLGRPAPDAPPPWLLVAAGPAPAAFAFDRLEGLARLPAAEVREAASKHAGPAGALFDGAEARALLDVPWLLEGVGIDVELKGR